MAMVNCMVKSCKNKGKIPGITYHQIPRSHAAQWFIAVNRNPNETVSLRNVVCSQHFKTEDFKGGNHMCLKKGAVPSINLGEISSNNDVTDNNFVDLSTNQVLTSSETDNRTYTLLSTTTTVDPDSLSYIAKEMYDYCSQKERDPLGDDDEEQTLMESLDNEKSNDSTEMHKKISEIFGYNEDSQEQQIVIESSDNEKSEESTEQQRKLIKEFHDYSITPGKHERLAVQQTVRSIRKKLKAAQQKHRRLERRVIRLKETVEQLKQKNV